jgi:hypothetical protein
MVYETITKNIKYLVNSENIRTDDPGFKNQRNPQINKISGSDKWQIQQIPKSNIRIPKF